MKVEELDFLDRQSRQTVKDIDKKAIEKTQFERSLEGITVLGVDEIAVGRGHNYLHIISSLDGANGSEVLYVGEGRKEEDLRVIVHQ